MREQVAARGRAVQAAVDQTNATHPSVRWTLHAGQAVTTRLGRQHGWSTGSRRHHQTRTAVPTTLFMCPVGVNMPAIAQVRFLGPASPDESAGNPMGNLSFPIDHLPIREMTIGRWPW